MGGTPGLKRGEEGVEEDPDAREGEEGCPPMDFRRETETGGGEEKERLPVFVRGFLGGTGALEAVAGGTHWGGGVRLIAPDSRERASLGGMPSGVL